MTKKVKYGEGRAEIVSVNLEDKNGEIPTVINTYVPPKTNTWSTEEYDEIIEDTITCLKNLIKSRKVLLVGDFNCKEVNWETYEGEGGKDAWGDRFLKMTTENLLMLWVTENTRYRRDDKPARLDLILTKGLDLTKELSYGCPIGKSDHVIMEFEIDKQVNEGKREEMKKMEERNGRTE